MGVLTLFKHCKRPLQGSKARLIMKVTVELRRQTIHEPNDGYLRAFVVDDGKSGRNILPSNHYTGVEAAKRAVTRELSYLLPNAQITFISSRERPTETSARRSTGRSKQLAQAAGG